MGDIARKNTEAMARRTMTVEPYRFHNEIANKFIDDDESWMIVQGPFGRVPVLAGTDEEAKDAYLKKYADEIDHQEEEDEFM